MIRSLSTLRRHQSLIEQQIALAYEQENTPALERMRAWEQEIEEEIYARFC